MRIHRIRKTCLQPQSILHLSSWIKDGWNDVSNAATNIGNWYHNDFVPFTQSDKFVGTMQILGGLSMTCAGVVIFLLPIPGARVASVIVVASGITAIGGGIMLILNGAGKLSEGG